MRRVSLVLVCEDTQQEVFCRRFLETMGWELREIRIIKSPSGRGAGEQFVRENYPKELRARRSQHAAQAVIVMLDGDTAGVQDRVRKLDKACERAGVEVRRPDEPVGLFVPTRNIETWFAYLEGRQVSETDTYPRLERERNCRQHVDTLVAMCKTGKLRQPAPSSLVEACTEYRVRLEPLREDE